MDCVYVDNLTRTFNGIYALRGISFKVDCGGSIALIGPNGAGKTTTLRILAGLLRPDSGVVRICGYDPFNEADRAKACIGYLPEDAVPFLNLTVRENLEYVAILRRLGDVRGVVNEILRLLDIEDIANKVVSSLSRGNRQRVAIAMAIIHKPKVLLLDEPLNYLDIPTQERVIEIFRDLNRAGTTIIVSTHIMSIAERIARDALIMNKGSIVWRGSINELNSIAKSSGKTIEEVIVKLLENSAG
ncbi:MAG: multidrug ABC transporter ATP-binding protein [Vulcanisaeta sp. CIS_19]|nr:MAG: multidrug ABC transporter ATP-binding protein [Vulcanisaeta sp. CIS_19]